MYRHPPQDPVQGQALPQRFLRRLGPQLLRPVVVLLLNTNLRLGLEDEEPQADLPFFNSQKPRMLPYNKDFEADRDQRRKSTTTLNQCRYLYLYHSIPVSVSICLLSIYLSPYLSIYLSV